MINHGPKRFYILLEKFKAEVCGQNQNFAYK